MLELLIPGVFAICEGNVMRFRGRGLGFKPVLQPDGLDSVGCAVKNDINADKECVRYLRPDEVQRLGVMGLCLYGVAL